MSADHARLLDGLGEMRRETWAWSPGPVRREEARAAMLAAVAARGRRPGPPWHRLLEHRLGFTSGALAASAAATVLSLGWSAPAGSALHHVRLAREQVQLDLPGADRAGLILGWAEDRLHDAQAGIDPPGSLEEARGLLERCPTYLPGGHHGPLWTRWDRDEALLARLLAAATGSSGSAVRPQAPAAGTDGSGAARGGGSTGGPGAAVPNGGPTGAERSEASTSEGGGQEPGEGSEPAPSTSTSSRSSTSQEGGDGGGVSTTSQASSGGDGESSSSSTIIGTSSGSSGDGGGSPEIQISSSSTSSGGSDH